MNRQCQNCKISFEITEDDLAFYTKISVPPPTFCAECRMQRRLAFRNERSLYKRVCDLCKKDIIAMYPADAPFPVHCRDCWWGDKWDPLSYGVPYDFSKPFFEQYFALQNRVPRLALFQRNMVNSPYMNFGGETKNTYLSYSVVESEDVSYSRAIDKSFRIFDCLNVADSEQCYGSVDGEKNYNSHFLVRSRNCVDSWFLFDCAGCKHSVLSANLRNQEYVIRGKRYSRDDYFQELKKINFGDANTIETLKKEFSRIKESAFHKYANIIKSVNTTGDHIHDAKNTKECFDVHDTEDVTRIVRGYFLKDCADGGFFINSELVYEYTSGGKNLYDVKFTTAALEALTHAEYTDLCGSSSYLFGCIAVRNGEYSILNRRYGEKDWKELVQKIRSHMDKTLYINKQGIEYRYGEFFPFELSPHAYNETIAQEYFPMTTEEVIGKGYRWQAAAAKEYLVTRRAAEIPANIAEVQDSILNETIGCSHEGKCNEQCTRAFKVIPPELQFYRKIGFPIPRLCPNCRHYERLKERNPLKLWHRQCMCDYKVRENSIKHQHHSEERCPNEFETSYSPDRKEAVYCEQCYNAEVA